MYKTIAAVLLFLISIVASADDRNQISASVFNVNTYANTCRGPNKLAKCVFHEVKVAMSFKRFGPYSSSRLVETDSNKLRIEFAGDENLYALELLSYDKNGWEQDYEIVDSSGCVKTPGPDRQVFHTSTTMAPEARIYLLKPGVAEEPTRPVDISNCK